MVVHACLLEVSLVVSEHPESLLIVGHGKEGRLSLDLADDVFELGLASDVFAEGVAQQGPERRLQLLLLFGLVSQPLLFPRFSLDDEEKIR